MPVDTSLQELVINLAQLLVYLLLKLAIGGTRLVGMVYTDVKRT